ncbi:putative entry exclusion protein TrbK-alt [Paracoccus denitrificans]|uniref:putative entry exclusion protein TrbK-alt n=1 Tax=Paracoccus denitrificans TaxID=266 RepID=UPI001E4A2BD3|nr:putative entry exclusion protein TrbK-alt [Paracoccus denitrificans]UFS67239.1 putative entry exclusion protein TrbK-alt [Paracoccus denitrificans]
MEGRILAGIGAILFVAIVVTAMLIGMTPEDAPERVRAVPEQPTATDPLRVELRRCQQLGETATGDADCLRIWAESRDRFLDRTPAQSAAPASPPVVEGR